MRKLATVDHARRDAGDAADTLLGFDRASALFVLVVFVTTLGQVVALPIAALMAGTPQWTLPVSEPITFAVLVVGCAAQSSTLLLSGLWPRTAVVTATAVYLALALGLAVPSWLIGMYLVIALTLFLFATRTSATVSMLWAVGVVTVTMSTLFWWLLSIGTDLTIATGYTAAEAARFAAPVLGGTALGLWWGAHARRTARAREEAERTKQQHDHRVIEATEYERSRIAQELHDVAGQHLAGLVTLADAALALAATEPVKALELVAEVRDEGRFAAASLAGALSDLRAVGGAPSEATRDLRHAPDLVDYWQRRGMPLQYAPQGPVADLPAIVSTTAYRCVQEALTNAAKHAPGADVRLTIRARPYRLDVSIENDAPRSASGDVPGLGLGWGLSGMRERITLLHGTLSTAVPATGGWKLAIEIPVPSSAEKEHA